MVLFRDYEKWGRVACLRKHGLLRGEVGSQGCRTLCCDSFPPTFFVLVWATLCKSGLTLDSVQGSLLAGLWIEPRSSTWKAANALPTVLFCLFPVQSSENWCHFEHYLKFIRFFSFSTIFFCHREVLVAWAVCWDLTVSSLSLYAGKMIPQNPQMLAEFMAICMSTKLRATST